MRSDNHDKLFTLSRFVRAIICERKRPLVLRFNPQHSNVHGQGPILGATVPIPSFWARMTKAGDAGWHGSQKYGFSQSL